MKNHVQALSKGNKAHLKSSSLAMWVLGWDPEAPETACSTGPAYHSYLTQIGLGDELAVFGVVIF